MEATATTQPTDIIEESAVELPPVEPVVSVTKMTPVQVLMFALGTIGFLYFAHPVFVPYFGPVAGVFVLAAVGLLTFDTLWQALLPPTWYLLLHSLEANLVTPVLLGRRFTLNPVVIFVSLIFWTWLWGVPGALLSVPILASMKVVCDRVPAMSSVSELLSQ